MESDQFNKSEDICYLVCSTKYDTQIIGLKLVEVFTGECTSLGVPTGGFRLIRSCYLTAQVETNADMCIKPLHNG